MALISPSILNVESLKLLNTVKLIEQCGADMLHVDVMDGIFVPNISFGIDTVKSIYENTKLPLDIHLMVDTPLNYIDEFSRFATFLGIHYEADANCRDTLNYIKSKGCKTCLTVKPKTDINLILNLLPYCDMVLLMSVEPGFGGQKFIFETTDKISKLKKYIIKNNYNILLEVDGGINGETAVKAVSAGADVLVVGSYLFNDNKLKEKIDYFKSL